MRKYFILSVLSFALFCTNAQNIQFHYDFGKSLYNKDLSGRPVVTTTVEMFKPDAWGSTYFFVDMDYTSDGVAAAYWEIARQLRFWENPFSIHVEYNGGLSNQFSYLNAYLGGATYTYNSSDFTRGFTFSTLYKYIQKHNTPHNYQLTGTWYLHFGNEGLFSFMGFADWWREKNEHGDFIFLAEPQFWLNLNKLKCVDDRLKLSVGSEVELSHNFGGRDGFYVIPTLAVKWTFN